MGRKKIYDDEGGLERTGLSLSKINHEWLKGYSKKTGRSMAEIINDYITNLRKGSDNDRIPYELIECDQKEIERLTSKVAAANKHNAEVELAEMEKSRIDMPSRFDKVMRLLYAKRQIPHIDTFKKLVSENSHVTGLAAMTIIDELEKAVLRNGDEGAIREGLKTLTSSIRGSYSNR